MVTSTPTLAPRGPNDGLPSLGPNKYYFIFALFSNFYIYKLYFYFYL